MTAIAAASYALIFREDARTTTGLNDGNECIAGLRLAGSRGSGTWCAGGLGYGCAATCDMVLGLGLGGWA